MSDIKLALEELELMEDDYEDKYQQTMDEFETGLEALDGLINIVEYRQSLSTKSNISQEDIDHLKDLVTVAFGLEDHDDTHCLFPSLEHYTDVSVALENFDKKLSGTIVYMWKHLIDLFKSGAQFTQYAFSIINLLNKKFDEAFSSANQVKDINITVPVSNYVCYGERKDVVKDEKEYIQKLEKSVSLLCDIADNFGTYTKNSLLDNIRVAFAYLTLRSDNKLESMFDDLYKMTKGISNNPEMRKTVEGGNGQLSVYRSDVMLGMYKATISQPPTDINLDTINMKALKRYTRSMYLGVEKYISRYEDNNESTVEFHITKSNLSKIESTLRPLTQSYKSFNSNLSRLVMLEKMFNISHLITGVFNNLRMISKGVGIAGKSISAADQAIKSGMADSIPGGRDAVGKAGLIGAGVGVGLSVAGALGTYMIFSLTNVRVFMKASSNILQNNHKIFTLTRGHLKTAILIAEKSTR